MKSLKTRIKNKRKTNKINRLQNTPNGNQTRSGKRVWMFRKGNLVVCYRVPFVKIQKGYLNGGAASSVIDKSKAIDLFGKLKTDDKDTNTYIYDNKQVLADDLLKSIEQPGLKSVYDSLKNDTEPDSNILIDWVKKRKLAQEIIKSLKDKINSPEGKKIYGEQDLAKLEKVLNNEDLCNSPGKLSSIASSVFDRMKTGATSLGEFLTPGPVDDKEQYNENVVQLLWFPRSSRHYKRGNSSGAVDKKDFRPGDFMIYVQPEKYADSIAYLSDMLGSVEDYFTNVLDACNGPFCLTGDVKRKPIKHQVIRSINHGPQIAVDDFKDTFPMEIR